MRVIFYSVIKNSKKDSLDIISKDFFYCTCFFHKSKKLTKLSKLPVPQLLIHEFREFGPSVDMDCFSGQLHVSDQFVPTPVHIVVKGNLGVFPVINDGFVKVFGMISGMNSETGYDLTFIYLIECDRFLKNKEISDNNALSGDDDLLSGIPEQ